VTATLQQRVEAVYRECDRLAGLPYVFSGGHNSQWKPSLDYAQGIGEHGAGIDCSAGASFALRAGGILWNPRPPLPLATGNLIEWGEPGVGRWLTLYVRNDNIEQHCGLRFNGLPAFQHEWWQAANPNDGVGWLALNITGMQARHWPGT
jgi:hypothetical protein